MRVDRRQLRPHRADATVSNRARDRAEQWRLAGLAVEMVEYLNPASEPGGYVLTGRSLTSVISCRCEIWLRRTLPWRGRVVWTIVVSVRSAHTQADIGAPPPPPVRQAGFAAAWDHDAAWEIVQAWIDGVAPLPPTLADALAALPF